MSETATGGRYEGDWVNDEFSGEVSLVCGSGSGEEAKMELIRERIFIQIKEFIKAHGTMGNVLEVASLFHLPVSNILETGSTISNMAVYAYEMCAKTPG